MIPLLNTHTLACMTNLTVGNTPIPIKSQSFFRKCWMGFAVFVLFTRAKRHFQLSKKVFKCPNDKKNQLLRVQSSVCGSVRKFGTVSSNYSVFNSKIWTKAKPMKFEKELGNLQDTIERAFLVFNHLKGRLPKLNSTWYFLAPYSIFVGTI